MTEDTRSIDRTAMIVLVVASLFIVAPLLIAFVTATLDYPTFVRDGVSIVPRGHLPENIAEVWARTDLPRQTFNSFVTASGIAIGKVALAFTTAFALVFFRSHLTVLVYFAVLATIMLPLDLVVVTAYQVTANVAQPINWIANVGNAWAFVFGSPLGLRLNLLDTYAGIIVPKIATGAGVLIMVQFMRTLPGDLARAAIMDGASPLRFMWDVVLPLSKAPLIALGLFFFIGGWGEFLWPLIAASRPEMLTGVVGLTRLELGSGETVIPNYPLRMTGTLMVSLIPLIMIAVFQRRIVRGLTYSDR